MNVALRKHRHKSHSTHRANQNAGIVLYENLCSHPSSSDKHREYTPSATGGVLKAMNPLLCASFWLKDPLMTCSLPLVFPFILTRIFVGKRPMPLWWSEWRAGVLAAFEGRGYYYPGDTSGQQGCLRCLVHMREKLNDGCEMLDQHD